MSTPTLDTALSLNDILRVHPAAVTLLHGYGIDTCCRGDDSLAVAAQARGLDGAELAREILAREILATHATAETISPASCGCGCRHVE